MTTMLTENDLTDRQMALDEAMDLMGQALEAARFATRGTPLENRAERQCFAQLEQAMSDDNRWMGGACMTTLEDLRDELAQFAPADADTDAPL